jgi:capsular polysaccharide biosynthesis protein
MILAILMGAFTALAIALFTEFLSHTFNNNEDIKKHLNLPVFASIPVKSKLSRRVVE